MRGRGLLEKLKMWGRNCGEGGKRETVRKDGRRKGGEEETDDDMGGGVGGEAKL